MITQKKGKYIVFDVDETLGYFSQLGSFMDALSFYNKDYSGTIFERFNEILDLYPEFIRPKMIEIMKYIHEKKISGICSGVFIYTNNQGPRIWVEHIAKYFDYKIGNSKSDSSPVFDKIIGAYMIKGKVVEEGRSSESKRYEDLLRITGISSDSEICFVDDLNHREMRHERVLYINVKPYVKILPVSEMIVRYLKSDMSINNVIRNKKEFIETICDRMGIIKNLNIKKKKLNLHDSNYIFLNTQDELSLSLSLSREEEIENKKSGEKLFNYIKLFLKMKQHSRQGTKKYIFHESRSRRREDEGKIRRRLYALKDIKTRKYNKRSHVKTQRMGKNIQI